VNSKDLNECDTYGCYTKVIVVDGEKLQRIWEYEEGKPVGGGWRPHKCYINLTREERLALQQEETRKKHLSKCRNPDKCEDWTHLVPCEVPGCRTHVLIKKGEKFQRKWKEGKFIGFFPHKCYTPPTRRELPEVLYISEWRSPSGGTKYGNLLTDKHKAERAPDVPAVNYEKTGNEGTKLTFVALWKTEVNWENIAERES
jgi:hypothetical protein